MEVLPHFWITYYKNNLFIIKKKKIKHIIHLSKNEPFIKKNEIEQIRIPIDYNDSQSYEEQNNIMYQHLFDITDYIHEKIINNENILLIGYEYKQDIETIIVSYFIRFGKLNIRDSIIFLKSKKHDIFEPKCLFYPSLNKFYNEFNKNN
jgi:hypothetical protein